LLVSSDLSSPNEQGQELYRTKRDHRFG
jgi:hypothetical protein